MDGLCAVNTVAFPCLDDAPPGVADWARRYPAQFQAPPSVFRAYGYTKLVLIVRALERVGQTITTEGFTKVLESLDVPGDIFGDPPMRFSAAQHVGSSRERLSWLRNGRWKGVLDHDQFR